MNFSTVNEASVTIVGFIVQVGLPVIEATEYMGPFTNLSSADEFMTLVIRGV